MREFCKNFKNDKKVNESFYYYAYIFILFSFVGWILEMIYHFAQGIFTNRGFLTGPFCIIYGFGALIILLLNKKITLKNKISRYIIIWMGVFILCTILEYITSFFLEIILGIRLWDYSGEAYNFEGRIKLFASIVWSNCGILLILIKSKVDKLYNKLSKNKEKFFCITRVILVGMCIDYISSLVYYILKK